MNEFLQNEVQSLRDQQLTVLFRMNLSDSVVEVILPFGASKSRRVLVRFEISHAYPEGNVPISRISVEPQNTVRHSLACVALFSSCTF